MNIALTSHAKESLLKRDITVEEIKSCIIRPDYVSRTDSEKIYAWKRFPGHVLVVIYKENRNTFIVITAYIP